MMECDVAVVGGGISGLSMAHFLAGHGLKAVVLEKDRRPGGAMHSVRHPTGFWVELGAHTAYNSYGRLLGLMEEHQLTQSLQLREKASWLIWEEDKLLTIASRLRLGELLLGLPGLLFKSRQGRTVAEFFGQVTGARNYRETVGPMLTAMTSQDPGEFPATMLFKKRPRRKDIARSFTLPNGMQSITDTLSVSSRFTVLNATEAQEILPQEGGYEVRSDNQTLKARAVAMAAPVAESARLLAAAEPQVAQVLARVRQHEFDSMGVVVSREETPLPPLAGMIALGEPFYSVVSRDVVDHPEYRGFVFHFRPGADLAQGRERIAQVVGVHPSAWHYASARRNVLPSPQREHPALLAELEALLQGRSLALTGNYFGGLALEDCVQRSWAEAERLSGLLKAGA